MTPAETLLAIPDDGDVGAMAVAILSIAPRPAQFVALGAIIRAADPALLEQMLAKGRRR